MRKFTEWIDDPNCGFLIPKTYDQATGELVAKPSKLILFPWERKILDHALELDDKGHFKYETVIISVPKKSGKTTKAAAIGCWFAEEGPDAMEIYCLANAREQAEARSFTMMKYHADRQKYPQVMKYRIEYPSKASFIQVLSTRAGSVAGAQQALTIWDELWNYETEDHHRLWEEMTPIPTEPTQLRLVVTYAGFEGESTLLWDLYKMTVLDGEKLDIDNLPCYTSRDGSIFCYWDHEPRMPWQTKEYYSRQAKTMRPSQFLRLHRNEWVSTEDTFIDINWWDKAVEAGKEADLLEPILYRPDSPYRDMPIYLAVDVGVKRDASAVVGVYYDVERGRIGLACHEIWVPMGQEVNLENNVEAYIKRVCSELNVISIVADPTQFKRSMQTLEAEGLPVTEFPQSITGMQAATAALYEQLKHGVLEVYPDDQVRAHLQFARAKIQNGKARIVKDDKVPRPVDAAVALAMAVYTAMESGGVDTSEEIQVRSPFSANTGYKYISAEEAALPPQFRS